ncbi:hypothetical protein VTH82DRAFT_1891 [Thermothelomyces myriococcoides]
MDPPFESTEESPERPRGSETWSQNAGDNDDSTPFTAPEGSFDLAASIVKTFSNLLNSVHHPFAGARCSAASGGAADSIQTE